jgi:hypothetical protein
VAVISHHLTKPPPPPSTVRPELAPFDAAFARERNCLLRHRNWHVHHDIGESRDDAIAKLILDTHCVLGLRTSRHEHGPRAAEPLYFGGDIVDASIAEDHP